MTPHTYRVHVTSPSSPVLSGVAPSPDGSRDTYEAYGIGLDAGPYFAFGAWRTQIVNAGGATIAVGIVPSRGARAMRDDDVARWIASSADSLAAYLHASPALHPLVLVVTDGDRNGINGKTLGDGGASIFLNVGADVSPAAARENWVLMHEMIHLEMPSLGYPHVWLEEKHCTRLVRCERAVERRAIPRHRRRRFGRFRFSRALSALRLRAGKNRLARALITAWRRTARRSHRLRRHRAAREHPPRHRGALSAPRPSTARTTGIHRFQICNSRPSSELRARAFRPVRNEDRGRPGSGCSGPTTNSRPRRTSARRR